MSPEPDPRDQWAVGSVGQSSYGRVFRTERGWVFDDDSGYDAAEDISNFRPLVVIDPEDREAVERLIDSYVDVMHGDDANGTRRGAVLKMQAALRDYANPKPPRPDEPQGLGAVVEDEDGARWARARVLPSGDLGAEWVGGTPARWADYEDIKAVRVVVER